MVLGRSNQPTLAQDGEESCATSPASGPARQPSRPLVLVVEDDPHDWEIYGKILWYNGYDVCYAAEAEEGYRLAREHRPDLILLDLMLPKIDGLTLCRRIREDGSVADIPIIVLSGRPFSELGQTALDLGCRAYLEKPISPVDVLRRIGDLVGWPPPSGVGRAPEKYPPDA
jgi:two-component system, cell cycle response regulator DivK